MLIVGAGPVGLTLAVDLGQRGVRCILVERKPAPQFLPKMERCNARTMEIFRRMGLAAKVRAAGLPAGVPMDVFIVRALNLPPLLPVLPWANPTVIPLPLLNGLPGCAPPKKPLPIALTVLVVSTVIWFALRSCPRAKGLLP